MSWCTVRRMGRSISAPGSVTFRSRSTISLPRLGSYRGEAQARPGGTAGWSGRAADLMAHRPGRLPHRVGGVAARARLWHHRGGLSLGGWDRPEGDLVTAGVHSDRIISGPHCLVVLATQMPASRCCRVPWWILSLSRGGSSASALRWTTSRRRRCCSSSRQTVRRRPGSQTASKGSSRHRAR